MRRPRLRLAYFILHLSHLLQVFCLHVKYGPVAGQSVIDQLQSITKSSSPTRKIRDTWRNASRIVEPRENSSHKKRLRQPSNQERLAAFPCSLNASVLASMHDEDKVTWLIDDSILYLLDGNIQSIINCTSENDTILIETNRTLRPQTTLTIPWNLTLSSNVGDTLVRNGTFAKAKDRVMFTCPTDQPLIVARTPSFAIVNTIIFGCDTDSDIVLLKTSCIDTQSRGEAQFVHVDFKNNRLDNHGSLINGSRAICAKLSLEDMEFHHNSCDGEGCVLLSANSALQDTRVLNNRKATDSSSNCSMFSTQEGSQVYIKNMLATSNEVRIVHARNTALTIEESYFQENMREQSSAPLVGPINGGVLLASQSVMSIKSSTFAKNYATSGGAIYATSSSLDIGNSTLRRNGAKNGRGGAVFVKNGGLLAISYTTFTNNFAREGGGALHTTTMSSTLSQCTFDGNNASFGGACEFQDSSSIHCEGSLFVENHASQRWGGALLVSRQSNLQMNNSTIQRNYASENGGAIDASFDSQVRLEDVYLKSNTARRFGGSVHLYNGTYMDIFHSFFSGNRAVLGGAIQAERSSTIRVSNSSFHLNKANYGGCISTETASNLTVSQSAFVGNEATENGGAIFNKKESILDLSFTNFTRNSAKEGGALHTTTVSSTLRDCILDENEASFGGACEFQDNSSVYIEGSLFVENHAFQRWGGALLVTRQSILQINNSKFKGNYASETGGAIDARFGSQVHLKDIASESNIAVRFGGSIHLYDRTNMIVDRSSFSGNRASSGGAIQAERSSTIRVSTSSFHLNKANYGGCISTETASNLTVSQSAFVGNEATENGGAIFNKKESILNLSFTNFTRNSATEGGGALHATSVSSTLNDCMFVGNNASYGGACAFQESSSSHFKRSLFVENYSYQKWGGALLVSKRSILRVNNSTFKRNHASKNGGAIDARVGSQAHLESVISENNTSPGSGGSIHLCKRTNMIVYRSSFKGNRAFSGGAIQAERNSTIRLSNSSFKANKATYGGGISTDSDSRLNTLQNSFAKNKATKGGGAIFSNVGSILNLDLTHFAKNSAMEGGALHIKTVYAMLSECTFIGNNASAGAGGACQFQDNSSVYVEGLVFSKNLANLESGGAIDINSNTKLFASNLTIKGNRAEKDSGGISVRFGSFLNASTMFVTSNSARDLAGGIGIFDDSSFLCYSCLFKNNAAENGAGIYVRLRNKSYTIVAQLQDCRFVSNSASVNGGGFMFEGPLNNVRNLAQEEDSFCHIILLNTSFVNNFATQFGSAILATNVGDVLVSCNYTRGRHKDFLDRSSLTLFDPIDPKRLCESWKGNHLNESRIEGVVGTFGKKLLLSMNSTNSSSEVQLAGNETVGFILKNMLSGEKLPLISILVVDEFGNGPAPSVPRSFLIEITSSNKLFQGVVPVPMTRGVGNFSDIPILKPPGCYTLNIDPNITTIRRTMMKVYVRSCLINEAHAKGEWSCRACGENSYNFDPVGNHRCLRCPEEATCQDHYIVPKNGYWHKGPCYANVTQCIVEEACTDDNREGQLREFSENFGACDLSNENITEYEQKQCSKGYKGPLCGSCAKGFGLSGNLECLKCGFVLFSVLRFLGIVLYLFVGTILTIKGTLPIGARQLFRQDAIAPLLVATSSSAMEEITSAQVEVESQEDKSTHVKAEVQKDNDITQVATCEEQVVTRALSSQLAHDIEKAQGNLVETWKILINFFQVTSTAATMDVKWTKNMLNFFNTLSLLGAATINSVSRPIDCIVALSSTNAKVVWRYLLNFLVPLIVIVILSIYWGYHSLKRQRPMRFFLRRFVLVVITVTYITYFDITQVVVSVFNCVNVYDGEDYNSPSSTKYWIVDTSIECYKRTHVVLVGISLVILMLVSICFPLACSWALFKTKDEVQISTSRAHETLGLLCGPFKRRFVFWECVTMLKKALLSVIIVFSYSLGNQAQGLLISIVLVFFLSLHTTCYPFKEEFSKLNYYESGSLLTSCTTYTLVQFFNVETLSESARTAVSLVLIILNGGFVLIMAFTIVRNFALLAKAILLSNNVEVSDNTSWISIGKLYLKNRKFIRTNT